jgi:serine/threonine protein kinase
MVGQTIGKYRIVDRLGRGGMGTVYRAVDETLHRDVAIKVLNTELNDPGVGRRFRAEAVAIARLNHPGIAMIYELVPHEGQWLMVIEFVRGETLESLVGRSGALPLDQAAELCIQVLSALAHAHSMGVVHRDLKPANIMRTAAGTTKIMDFGIARVAGTEHLTRAGITMGTPAYMAPEQVLGGHVDARTDLYAMGVVLYHLLTAALPFKGDTPMAMAQSRIKDEPTPIRTVRPDLPEWISLISDRALKLGLDARYQTADEMRDALRRGISGRQITVAAPTTPASQIVADVLPSSIQSVPGQPASTSHTDVGPTLLSPSRLREADLPTLISPPPPAARPPEPAGTSATTGPATSRLTTPLLVAAAVGAVMILVGGVWLVRTLLEPQSTTTTTTPSTTSAGASATPPDAGAPATTSTPATSPGPQPVETLPAGASPSGTTKPPIAPGRGSSPSGTGPAESGGSQRGSIAPPPGASRSGAGSGRETVPDPVVRIQNVKQLVVTGRNGSERDAVMYLGGGLISILTSTGAGIATFQYPNLSSATYVRAKDPKWNESLPGPPANLDVPGGILRPQKHWLTLQSTATYVLLRLEDANWRQVIEIIESRTGRKVTEIR